MKNQNFFVVQGWMINELGLSGNELIIYAVIYGFSQDGQSFFKGSKKYLQDCTNTSKDTVLRALKSLQKKGLIEEIEIDIQGVIFKNYKCLRQGVAKCDEGGSKMRPHNIVYNNINTHTHAHAHTHEEEQPKQTEKKQPENGSGAREQITEEIFLKRWADARMYYDKKPTHIKRLQPHEKTIFKELLKHGYTKQDFDKAIEGLFNNATVPKTRTSPSHLLNEFEIYLDAGLNGTKDLYKQETKIVKHEFKNKAPERI